MDIEDIWYMFRYTCLNIDRLGEHIIWGGEYIKAILKDYLIKYYGVSLEYFDNRYEEYDPSPYFNWGNGAPADLLEYTYQNAFELLRRDLEEYKKD